MTPKSKGELVMADMAALKKIVQEYVQSEYVDEDDDAKIGLDTPLISGGIVDSFSMVSLKTFLERKYKISIPDAKATPEAFDSVNKIANLMAEFVK
jgi:acyl carrier protein